MTLFSAHPSSLLLIAAALGLAAFASPAIAQQPGPCLAEKLGKASPLPAIAPWSFTGSDRLALTAEQIVPRDFIEELERNVGKVTVHVTSANQSVRVFARAGGKVFAKWNFFPSPFSSTDLVIDGLLLENPMAKNAFSLKSNQRAKGLPLAVLRQARRQILEVAGAGGYKNLVSVGQDSYLLTVLYRKFLGLAPIGPEAEKAFAMLDRAFEIARHELPESFRIKSADELGDLVGSSKVRHNLASHRALWERFQKRGSDPDVQAVMNAEGHLIGAIFRENGRRPHLALINPLEKSEPLLEWQDILMRTQDRWMLLGVPTGR